ncbi:hypothetical protein AB0L49_42175 [Streptomyces antimycoticus]|uniref:hypothetical protein n=1 Tax=Streptomyces antimycoticus TaxID=68175 RepID=UPI00341CDB65
MPPTTPLFHLLHLGASTAGPPPELAAALDALGLLADRDDAEQARTHRTKDHYFTVFRGLLTVADHHDRPTRSRVHLGEDGLTFTDRLLSVHARGTVLNIGSGSGLTTSAPAVRGLHATAVDSSPARVAATTALNGLAHGVEAVAADASLAVGGLDWAGHLRLVRERGDEAASAARRHGDPGAVVAEVFGDAVERDPVHSCSLDAFLSALPGMP